MSANDMVTLIFSFMVPIVVMNLLFFGLGLSMEFSWGKRKKKEDSSEEDELLNQLIKKDESERKVLMEILREIKDGVVQNATIEPIVQDEVDDVDVVDEAEVIEEEVVEVTEVDTDESTDESAEEEQDEEEIEDIDE